MPRRALLCCCLALPAVLLARPVSAAQERVPPRQAAATPAGTAVEKPADKAVEKPVEKPAADSQAPGPAKPDESNASPKGALKLLAVALRDGDAPRIRQVMYAANPTEAKMIAAMAEMASATAALQRSAVKAFGRQDAKEVVGDTDATDAESQARIDAADVKVQGDTATVTIADGEEAPVVLRRVDGRWRMPMSELSRGAEPSVLDERLAALAGQAKLIRDLAEEIAGGKYASAAQAHDALKSRAMQASMQRPARAPAPPRTPARTPAAAPARTDAKPQAGQRQQQPIENNR